MLAEALRYIFTHWYTSFALTLAIEIPIFMAMTKHSVPPWRSALAGALGSCITHPLLWFVWRQVVTDYTLFVISGEVIVAAIESVTFFWVARPKRLLTAVGVSCIANGSSYGIGLLIVTFLR